MVQEVMTYLDSTPDLETKLELIDTLRTVTDGKVKCTFESCKSGLIMCYRFMLKLNVHVSLVF